MSNTWHVRSVGTLTCLLSISLLSGCVAQQADLKSAERRFKESNEALAQRGAQQRQELEELKSHELPKLRGELERAQHQAQEIQRAQDDLRQRSAVLEQQTRKLEQLSSKLEAESTNRYAQVRESLNAQDVKNKADRDQLRMDVNTRLDDVNRQMEVLRKEIIDAVQKTNTAFAKSIDVKLEEQRKPLADTQARNEQLSAKFTQFNQALAGFRDSLTSLSERIGQEEQASKALAVKIEADTKASTSHINETTKTMSGHLSEVNKSVAAVAQKLAARIDEQVGEVNKNVTRLDARVTEQEHRVDGLAKNVDLQGRGAKGQRQQQTTTKSTPRSSMTAPEAAPQPEPVAAAHQDPEMTNHTVERAATPAAEESPEPVQVAAVRPSERSDRAEYERILAYFKEGNLDGSREGFSAFLTEYPNSDLAPNARYWLGESHYGKKDYKQAIDSYDRVELDYPQSEKVPAAILKKGFAYLALKDKKRASSAFKQVVTLYPKSPEAGKAYDKLNQLKELR
jgi:tol-pal system protein YbgF